MNQCKPFSAIFPRNQLLSDQLPWVKSNTVLAATLAFLLHCINTFEFSLNVFTEFSDKKICHHSKRTWTCHPATSCVRDQDATTVPARHMWETGSLNWVLFMLQWFIRFPEFAEFSEFLFHLGKTPLFLHSPYHTFWNTIRYTEV